MICFASVPVTDLFPTSPLPLGCQLHESRGFIWLVHWDSASALEKCLACSRHLITVGWMLGKGMSVIGCARSQAPEFSEAVAL